MDTFDNVASEAFLNHSGEIITILGGPKQIISHFMSNESLNMHQITALKTILLNTHETTIQTAHQHRDVLNIRGKQGSGMIINYRNNISTVLVTRPYLEWVKDWDTNSPFVSSTSLINNGKHIQIASRGA
eukprot:137921_1